jgi:hypothetical protein
MSTKTLLKRLALGTVVALGASVLTVSSANAAGTAAIAIGANGATGAVSDGSKSAGLLSGAVGATVSTTLTATVLSGGSIGVVTSSGTGAETIVITGGTVTPSNAIYLSTDQTTATKAATGLGVQVKPNAGVTSMTIQVYDGSTLDSTSHAPTSKGTLSSQVFVTIATTSVSGAFSAAKSLVNTAASPSDATNNGVDLANTASGSISTIDNGTQARVNFTLNDAYGVPLPTGAVIVTSTGGGYVSFSGAPTGSTDVQTASSGYYTVKQSVSNTPQNVTTTVSYNGTVVATRSFNFLGNVAKIVASNPRVVGISDTTPATTAAAAFTLRYYDAAGVELFPSDATTATTLVSGLAGQVVSAATISTAGVSGDANHPYAVGAVTGITAGTASLQMQYVNATDGTIIKSNTWTQSVAGDAYAYTAAFDKATYTPGSVATLTITFTDKKGNLANHLANKITDAADTITIAGAPGTVVTAPASTDVAGGGTDAAGTKTYQFTVTQADGSYQAIVSAPKVDLPVTVAYTVASGGTTLNDVLKGIVSLIASINKQIAALAKLVAPKAVAKKK